MTPPQESSRSNTPLTVAFREKTTRSGSQVPVIEGIRDARSVVGEEFRLLRAKLRKICEDRGVRSMAVVSALPGEGKSTISMGLSAALAREPGRRILLIEADLRRPSISRSLQVPPTKGLNEWLSSTRSDIDVSMIEPGGFFLLGAGDSELDRPENMSSARMEALVRSARESFDMVVLDATPILPVADTVLVQDLVDGLLLVVRSRMTPREAIHDALGRIHPEKILGVVLNDHREYRESYYNTGYKRYGMRP